jgi:hypothetical protein
MEQVLLLHSILLWVSKSSIATASKKFIFKSKKGRGKGIALTGRAILWILLYDALFSFGAYMMSSANDY